MIFRAFRSAEVQKSACNFSDGLEFILMPNILSRPNSKYFCVITFLYNGISHVVFEQPFNPDKEIPSSFNVLDKKYSEVWVVSPMQKTFQ